MTCGVRKNSRVNLQTGAACTPRWGPTGGYQFGTLPGVAAVSTGTTRWWVCLSLDCGARSHFQPLSPSRSVGRHLLSRSMALCVFVFSSSPRPRNFPSMPAMVAGRMHSLVFISVCFPPPSHRSMVAPLDMPHCIHTCFASVSAALLPSPAESSSSVSRGGGAPRQISNRGSGDWSRNT